MINLSSQGKGGNLAGNSSFIFHLMSCIVSILDDQGHVHVNPSSIFYKFYEPFPVMLSVFCLTEKLCYLLSDRTMSYNKLFFSGYMRRCIPVLSFLGQGTWYSKFLCTEHLGTPASLGEKFIWFGYCQIQARFSVSHLTRLRLVKGLSQIFFQFTSLIYHCFSSQCASLSQTNLASHAESL